MGIEILIGQTLEVSENPGLETFDPRFTDISGLVMEGNYEEAAVQAEQVLEQGIYDIRIIGYFVYGVFLEQGVSSLVSVFETLSEIVSDNWEAIGPVKNRDKHTANTIKWFTTQLNKKLEYEENKKEAAWNTWTEETDSDQVQEAMDALEKLQRALGITLEDKAGPLVESMMKITSWLRAFQQIVYKEPEPESENEETEAVVEQESAPPSQEAQAIPISAPAISSSLTGSVAAEGSHHLQILLQKLDAFDRLIRAEKFQLAALVADDINGIIKKFDPKIYFPGIFAKFSFLFASNISQLISCEQYKNTIEWKALQELYKVDLESFVGFNADIDFSTPVSRGDIGQNGYGEENEYPEDGEDSQEVMGEESNDGWD